MIKIAMIGAGSVVFSKNLTGDILSFPEFKNATLAYMDIDEERLRVGADLCRKVAKAVGANPTIEAYTDRRKAIAGADFVINMVQIGGFDSTLVDFEIPRKYGLPFTIADTTGPGGLFRALRTFPMIQGLARDMEELCPRAVLLNYSNPMSMNMQTIFRSSGLQAVGLCHSVQGTLNQLMRYISVDPKDVSFICAGINHMAFYLKLEKDGVDLYPRLFEAMGEEKTYNSNRVRFELMRRLGYFITESSEHNAEYCPYFIPHGEEMVNRFAVPIDEYLRRCDGIVDSFQRMIEFSKTDEPIEVHRSHEYGSLIIHSMSTGTPRVVYGNMPNNGAISNLPKSAIVEVPTLVDRAGLQQTVVGELPPQLVAYMQPHVSQHELFYRAAAEGRRDHLYHASMFDPLTAAMLTLDQIVEMTDELIEAHGDLLPPLPKKTLVPTSGKQFGKADFKALHASWDARKTDKNDDILTDWQVLGPFSTADGFKADEATVVETTLDSAGKPDLSGAVHVGGKPLTWTAATLDDEQRINLTASFPASPIIGSFAYLYMNVDAIHARETVLKLASNGGLQVWLNGAQVLKHEGGRRYRQWSNSPEVRLNEGANHLLVKVSGSQHGWLIGSAIPKPTS